QTIKTNPDDFDILITDYSMPQLTGLELALDLSENNIDLPVMLISGFFGKNIEQAARELGITELITKPINTYQLTDAIHRLLSEKQA
ncbi:MAG: response regulator, partial [Desulfarculaceae bacterium]